MRDSTSEELQTMALLVAGHRSAALNHQRAFHPDRFVRFAYELVPALRKPRVDHEVVGLTFGCKVWPSRGTTEFGTGRLLREVDVVHYACGFYEAHGIAPLRNSDRGLEGVGHCSSLINELHDEHMRAASRRVLAIGAGGEDKQHRQRKGDQGFQ